MKSSEPKASDLRAKTQDELTAELNATQKELFSLQLQKGMGGAMAQAQAPRTHGFKLARRKIARIKTILNEQKKRTS